MRRNKKTIWSLVTLLLVMAVVASACGGDDEVTTTESGDATATTAGEVTETTAADDGQLEQLTFQLNWVAGGFNAGFAVARARGFYEEEGLFVYIVPGNGSGTTAQLTAAGNANIAYADSVATTQLMAKDAPLKVIATLYQAAPGQVTAVAGTGIESITDVAGKSVAYATGAAEAPMLPLLWEANGIDPDAVDLVGSPRESLVPLLLEGQVDAIIGSSDFYGIQLSDRGVETVDFPFYQYGVATVSTSIFANENWLAENPEVARGFVRASLKGWAAALEDPQAAVDDLVSLFRDVDPEEALKQLEATIPLFCANDAEYIGKATPEAWERHQSILEQVESLPVGADPTGYYTYDYLPSEDELTPCS